MNEVVTIEIEVEPEPAEAGAIVSGDQDLRVLHPWRGIAILRPAEYLRPP